MSEEGAAGWYALICVGLMVGGYVFGREWLIPVGAGLGVLGVLVPIVVGWGYERGYRDSRGDGGS